MKRMGATVLLALAAGLGTSGCAPHWMPGGVRVFAAPRVRATAVENPDGTHSGLPQQSIDDAWFLVVRGRL